jgi:small subunit ribosomal protein S17
MSSPEETATASATPAAEKAAPAPPLEVLAPKERRRRKRALKEPGPAGPRSPAERQEARDAIRKAKAKERSAGRAKARAKAKTQTGEPTPVVAEVVAGAPKVRQGIVVSAKAAKTITVRIDTSRRHRRYQKIVRSSKTLHAHDEHDDAHAGDLVRVVETRPLSKTKRWRLTDVLERAK